MNKRIYLGLLLAWAALQLACAANWKMDPASSRLDFAATFENTPAPGSFKAFDVQLRFDPQRLADCRLDVSIKVSSADMVNADINKAIAGIEWFDFSRHPQAEFHSTDIHEVQTTAATGRYLVRGTLDLKGVQQTVEVPFNWIAAGDGAIMDGTFTVKRGAFGIGTGEWTATDVIGADVTVKFHVRLRQVP